MLAPSLVMPFFFTLFFFMPFLLVVIFIDKFILSVSYGALFPVVFFRLWPATDRKNEGRSWGELRPNLLPDCPQF
jgi:hypothetical protein